MSPTVNDPEIAPLVRPAVLLIQPARRSRTPPAPGASRLGGLPELPDGVDWPADRGVPQMFIGQIDLAAVFEQAGSTPLPPSGYLWFFSTRFHDFSSDTFMDQRVAGLPAHEADARRASVAAVLYRDVTAAALAPRPYPDVGQIPEEAFLETHSTRPTPLSFERADTLPAPPSPFLPLDLEENDAYRDLLDATRDRLASSDWLLGHIPRGDWIGACGAGDRLLLRVSARNRAGYHWGDSDDAFFVISDADLAARRFDRVTIHCGLG